MEGSANNANFVFHGTVVQPGGSTMPERVPPSDGTAIVRVDDVVYAPPALANYAGQNVTVLLQDQEHVSGGEQATFYTNGWIFGESAAVRSEGHQDVTAARAQLSPLSADPVRNAATRQLQTRIADADAVVTGTVVSTHLVSPPPGALLAAAAPTAAGPVSEHDPEWHDAVIAVSGVAKGAAPQNEVVVRYPNSMDVRWYRVPKLRPGMTGAFVLHAAEKSEALAAPHGLSAAPQPPDFVLLHPEDFVPQAELSAVEGLISPAAANAQPAATQPRPPQP